MASQYNGITGKCCRFPENGIPNRLVSSNVVRLNVGGELFTTTRATLTRYPDSMLGAMFNGAMDTAMDESGCYFIDRDGTTFRHVLNFLRSGRLVLPSDFSQLDLLEVESDFYRLDPLIEAISLFKGSRSNNGSFLEIIEVRVGPTATMPTNNSRDKTVLSCRSDIIRTLPTHFFSPFTAERYQRLLQQPPPVGDGDGSRGQVVAEGNDEHDVDFVELQLVGSNVRLRLGEHLRRNGWTLCHSDMSSSSCGADSRSPVSGNYELIIEHSYRDRWYQASKASGFHDS